MQEAILYFLNFALLRQTRQSQALRYFPAILSSYCNWDRSHQASTQLSAGSLCWRIAFSSGLRLLTVALPLPFGFTVHLCQSASLSSLCKTPPGVHQYSLSLCNGDTPDLADSVYFWKWCRHGQQNWYSLDQQRWRESLHAGPQFPSAWRKSTMKK